MARIARNGVLVVFALLCVSRVLSDGFGEHAMIRDFWTSVPLLGAAAFAIALVCGIEWCRYPLRAFGVILLLFWSFLWAMQHAIDRTIGFWMVWIAVELLLIAVLFSTRTKYAGNAPKA